MAENERNERNDRQIVETYLENARSYRDMNDYDNAIAELTDATNLYTTHAALFMERGRCYRAKFHNGDRDPHNLKNSIDDFNRARQLLTGTV